MNAISRKLGLWCLRNEGIAESQYPIVIYGIELFLNTTLKVVGILAAGAILGMFAEVLLAMTVLRNAILDGRISLQNTYWVLFCNGVGMSRCGACE